MNCFTQQMYHCKTSLQVQVGMVGFQNDDREMFGCFAPVQYILSKINDILQSMCELQCHERSATEPKKLIIYI